jgi:hypothetical protein
MSAGTRKGEIISPGGSEIGKPPASPLQKNGSGPPLTYNEPSDDENMNEIIEEKVEIDVYLPNGKIRQVAVEPRSEVN